MKRFTFLLAIGFGLISSAQELIDYGPQNHTQCGNNYEQELIFQQNPQLEIQDNIDKENFEIAYQEYLQSYDPFARATYTIPVVIHIVHLGGSDNISNEQVYDGMENLNLDFNMAGIDLSDVVSAFSGIVGNVDIEFKLATRDPNGNCHLGITRTYSQYTVDDGYGDIRTAVINEHGVWPQNEYLNVFVCQDPIGAAGYTYLPGDWYNPNGMGGAIYLRHDYMGTIGTGSSSRRRTFPHECGHWLNLSHTWGSTNSAGDASSCSTDDWVGDTPNTIGNNSCNTSITSCSSLDNVQNIMDYTGSCRRMFTQGQAARMQTALNSSMAERNNLSTPANLIATGTDGPGDLCEIIFSSDVQVICQGESIDFSDDSFHNVVSRTWTFSGGTPATSPDINPTITYNTAGVYAVTLDATDGTNSLSDTKANYIVVLSVPGDNLPYFEGFEGFTAIPDNDRFVVYDESGTDPWQLSTSAGAAGSSQSALLNNFGNSDLFMDELISGTIDLEGVNPADPMVFNFEYAYRKISLVNDEVLRFYISKDCGQTWALRKVISGDGLSTVTTTSSYTPQNDGEWYSVDVTNINSDYYVADFRYKFQFENDNGNNIYIDNINLYPSSMTSLVQQDKQFEITVYPNPTNDKSNIILDGIQGQNVEISLVSSVGQEVMKIYSGFLNQSNNTFELNTAEIAEGIYLVRVVSENGLKTIKLVKN